MRMRKKKNRDVRIANCSSVLITEPYPKADWNKIFGNDNPVHLEIGCGKGSFITQLAEKSPDVNFIAIEKCLDVAVLAMEKTVAKNLKNVK